MRQLGITILPLHVTRVLPMIPEMGNMFFLEKCTHPQVVSLHRQDTFLFPQAGSHEDVYFFQVRTRKNIHKSENHRIKQMKEEGRLGRKKPPHQGRKKEQLDKLLHKSKQRRGKAAAWGLLISSFH